MKILNTIMQWEFRVSTMGLACWLLLFGLTGMGVGCKKTDKFYEKLEALPQINNTAEYSYKAAYIVGDTLTIKGKLQTQTPGFSVSIGGISATITNKIDSIGLDGNKRDQVSVLITEEMAGKNREVKVTSGGYSTLGANIDVYAEGGKGSIDAILTTRLVTTFSSKNIFLHCISGRGEVYYYGPADKKLYRVDKDGTQTELYDLSKGVQPGNIEIIEFVAGGVTPNGKTLYFSAKTSNNDYTFARIDLSTRTLTLINRSARIASPYQGNASDVNVVISGIYPDDKGNVYLGVGFYKGRDDSYIPGAIALYRSSDNHVSYLLKDNKFSRTFPSGLPGKVISFYLLKELRFSPSEGLLYLMSDNFQNNQIIDMYDLLSGQKLYTLSTNRSLPGRFNVITTFSSIGFLLESNTPNTAYGYLPIPGRRLQVLLYQEISGSVKQANAAGFPRWIVLDFEEERTYSYAKDRYRIGQYAFQRAGLNQQDLLLNYDEDGNLYSTANNHAVLIASRPLQ